MDETFGQMFDQLRQIRSEMEKAKARLRQKTIKTESGPVKLEMNGYQEVIAVSLATDYGSLRDLEVSVREAVNGAVAKSRSMVAEEMGRLMGGGLPPGFGSVFD